MVEEFNDEKWHLFSAAKVLEELGGSINGLSQKKAEQRLEKFGFNEITIGKKTNVLLLFFRQFSSFLVWVLIIAGIVSALIGDFLDSIVILVIIVLNAFFGFWQEFKAEKAMSFLKKMSTAKAKVFRDNEARVIGAKFLVPGDIIILDQGDKVPADSRILESVNIQADESILTGESTPVEKSERTLSSEKPLHERKNMLYSSTIISFGRGKAVVVSSGMHTEFGKIAKEMQEIKEEKSTLAVKVNEFGQTIGYLIIAACIAVLALLVFLEGFSFESVLVAIALAVAAIPEGLPAIVTICLALGMQEMAKHNVIIRKIDAVETLGATTIICTDKTGTITKNELSVRKISAFGKEFEIKLSGSGRQEWIVNESGKEAVLKNEKSLEMLLKTAVLCNNAELGFDGSRVGDPTELALLSLGRNAGIEKKSFKDLKFIAELPFDSERKRMSVVFGEAGKKTAYCKGSIEGILKICGKKFVAGKISKFSKAEKRLFSKRNCEMASNGLRVLGFAFKRIGKTNILEKSIEKEMVFLGIAGMIDSSRPESRIAVESCKKAGIKVLMLTGDHKLTALAVAREVGIAEKESEIISGPELDKLSLEEFKEKLKTIKVFARVSPEHKLMIVSALKSRGEVVAVTGDGVNDILALKKADIGVAMGVSGTDVAKEAGKMVITDDNFASIVKAVEEGRRIYQNIKNFIKFLFSANSGEVMVIATAVILRMPLPLIPLQILWVNLVTDGLPALALSMEKGDESMMLEKPRSKHAKIIDGLYPFIITTAILTTIAVLASFSLGSSGGIENARTMAFTTLVFFELFLVFSCRSEKKNAFEINPFSNKSLLIAVAASMALMTLAVYLPFMQAIFKTASISIEQFLVSIALSCIAFAVPLLQKTAQKFSNF